MIEPSPQFTHRYSLRSSSNSKHEQFVWRVKPSVGGGTTQCVTNPIIVAMLANQRIVLSARPEGGEHPSWKHFKQESGVINPQALSDNEVLVQVLYCSVDPAMRGWMTPAKSYIAPVKIGEVMRAQAVGVVVASRSGKVKPGDFVEGLFGWQQYAQENAKRIQKLDIDPSSPEGLKFLSAYLGVLGGTGMTAYFGFLDVGKPKAGDVVLVSAAAGAVGQIVGQIAKIKGCRVVGTAGGAEKCKMLIEEFGFDDAIDYKAVKSLRSEVKKKCPKGIDIYFDNVGGDHLEAALANMRRGARIVLCGAISQYNEKAENLSGPRNYMQLLISRARMEGFVVFDYAKQYRNAAAEMKQWIGEGKLKYSEYFVDGLESSPDALAMLFSGKNTGKTIVRIAPLPTIKSKL
jgi:NADPH-dependent curcumin reductase CurA